jgi:acetolactate synthase-1/2/3 large subunit
MGAKVGCPNSTVILIAGDGSIQMNIQELATVASEDIAVKIVILNNGVLGMVHQWQDMFFEKRYSHSEFKGIPDFVKLAEAYSLKAKRITNKSEVKEGIDFLLNTEGTVILDVVIPSSEMVFPMVPAGASLHEMIDYQE